MMQGARKQDLARAYRFSGRGSYSAALRGSRKLRGTTTVLHIASGTPGRSRFGLALTKRLAPRSVDRNRMKRVAREVFRRHAAKVMGLDLVLSPRARFSRESIGAWVQEIGGLFDRIVEAQ